MTYRIVPTSSSQHRLRGRFVAEPVIALEAYEIRAAFDWIEIFLETGTPWSGVNLYRRLSALNKTDCAFYTCSTSSPTRGSAYSGRGHVIRMQNPALGGLSALLRAFLALEGRVGCRPEDVRLTGFELSLDVYPAKRFCADEKDYAARRMLMTDLLRKHIGINEAFRLGKRRPRFTFAAGKGKTTTQRLIAPSGANLYRMRKQAKEVGLTTDDIAALDPRFHHQPFVDATVYFGGKDEQLLYRVMDKITDKRVGDRAESLPIGKTRSRIEFASVDEQPGDGLGPKSMGFGTLGDLGTARLTAFSTLLRFELPTFVPSLEDPNCPAPEAWALFAKSGAGGLSWRDDALAVLEGDSLEKRAMARRVVLSPGRNQNFSALNARVSKALKRLQGRWVRDWDGAD